MKPGRFETVAGILEAALDAVDPYNAVKNALRFEGGSLFAGSRRIDLTPSGRVFVAGGGKAAAPMALALEEILGERIAAGALNVKKGHLGMGSRRVAFGSTVDKGVSLSPVTPSRIKLVEAAHPVPDGAGATGARDMLGLLKGLTPEDLVVVLVSGGGSALLSLPEEGLTLSDLADTNRLLLGSGAGITEVNAVRKHLTMLSGGRLARAAMPAKVLTLILSDVVGSPLDVIASGPTVPDPTTYGDALSVVDRYGLMEKVSERVLNHLLMGREGKIPETPKTGEPCFENTVNIIVGDNGLAARAALKKAAAEGFSTLCLGSRVECEARELGRVAAGLAISLARGETDLALPAMVVFGGESTVTLRGKGKGGRNQEAALSAAIALDRSWGGLEGRDAGIFFLATDGNDGPTEAAGAFALPGTLRAGLDRGLNASAHLADNDSFAYFEALGALIVTGPTNTNVNDLTFLFAW